MSRQKHLQIWIKFAFSQSNFGKSETWTRKNSSAQKNENVFMNMNQHFRLK